MHTWGIRYRGKPVLTLIALRVAPSISDQRCFTMVRVGAAGLQKAAEVDGGDGEIV